jgi:uncharacterized protein YeaO (DUF488 family)
MIKIKRAYRDPEPDDGRRFLVDRVWPRGVKRADLQLEAWLRDAAPSTELRKWFGHDPQKWEAFQHRYFAELNAHPQAWRLLKAAAAQGDITLVYSAKDEQHNQARALKIYLEQQPDE